MDIFIKAIAGILICVIVCLILSQQGKSFSVLLTVMVSCMIAVICLSFLEQVIGFIHKIKDLGNLNSSYISVLLKCAGIAILSELTGMICVDSGNSALAKCTQMLAAAIILWLCIPLYTSLMELIEGVLQAI